MAERFCSNCGAHLVSGASFCIECGEALPGAKLRAGVGASFSLQRYAPLFVVLAVLAVGAGAITVGLLSHSAPPPTVPPHTDPQASGSSEGLPPGHPPLQIPEQVKQAIKDLQAKADGAPDDMEAWKRLAEVQYRAAQLDQTYLAGAATAYEHVLAKEPNNPDVIRALGNIAFDQEQPEKAVGYYQRYLKEKPDDLEVQTDLGTMYLSSGKANEAIAEYDKVLKSNPKFFQAQFNLAIAYRQLGEQEKTLAALEKSRELAPDDKTKTQVDQLIARAKGQPEPAAMAQAPMGQAPAGQAPMGQAPMGQAPAGQAAAPAAASSAPAGSFQADAEAIFRENPILGPKVQRIEWDGSESAKVYLHDFPMDQMPEEMKGMFTDRMKERIKEKKAAHQVTATAKFELIDVASGKLMDTLSE